MGIEVIRDEMADLVDPAAEPELVADGFQFTEGPVWDPAQVCLFFRIFRQIPFLNGRQKGVGRLSATELSFKWIDIGWTGRLLSCEHSGRRVSIEADGELKTVVDSYQGKKLNSPNDLIVCQNGDIIFTDPPYGLSEQTRRGGRTGIAVPGVYRLPFGESEAHSFGR